MKKGLMLSLVASTVLFAGGDIAPVEPVAEAPAADCGVTGHVGAGVIFNYNQETNASNATYGVAAVLGVEKEIFSGLTLTAKVQGAVTQYAHKDNADANMTREAAVEQGGLSELNLAYAFGNTAIKAGRFALDKSLSPLEYTDTNYFGLNDKAYEGVLVANTDIADTTIYGAYIHNVVTLSDSNASLNGTRTRAKIAALGLINESFADTKISLVGYYDINSSNIKPWTYAVAGSVATKLNDFDVTLAGAYAKPDAADANASIAAGMSVATEFSGVNAALYGSYSNDGALWINKGTVNPVSAKGYAVALTLGTEVLGGKLNGSVSYSKASDTNATKTTVGVGYGTTVSGIDLSADYKYTKTDSAAAAHRVRAKAVYKF